MIFKNLPWNNSNIVEHSVEQKNVPQAMWNIRGTLQNN